MLTCAHGHHLVACVYSDLFDEDCFEDHRISGHWRTCACAQADVPLSEMTLKMFKRGRNHQADTLLDWLEKGCYDALSKKYVMRARHATRATHPTRSLRLSYLASTWTPSSLQ